MHIYLRSIFLGIIVLALIGGSVAYLQRQEARVPQCLGCNVILISIDTLGAKHTTVHNPSLDTTPFLARIAAERGIVFEHAYAQAPWTLPSHVAMLTGRYPWDLGVWEFFNALPERAVTIAELFVKEGYATAAFSTGGFVDEHWQFDQGFEEFENHLAMETWNDLPYLFEKGAGWIAARQNDRPFFLFMRSFHVHDPYGENGVDIHDIVRVNLQEGGPTEEESRMFEAAYRQEVKEADAALETLFSRLEEKGLIENTIIIVTADHGEEFGEHGTAGFHSTAFYPESIHVPLIVFVPHAPAGRIVQSVEVRSIPATLYDLTGTHYPRDEVGTSLLPLMRGIERSHHLVRSLTVNPRERLLQNIEKGYATTNALVESGTEVIGERTIPYDGPFANTLILGPLQVIQTMEGDIEMYDLNADPNAQHNLATTLQPLEADKMFAFRALVSDLRLQFFARN